MNKKLIYLIGLILIVGIIATIIFSYTDKKTTLGGAFDTTNLSNLSLSDGLTVTAGATSIQGTAAVGASGTALNQILRGSCTIFAYTTTIAASSTGDVECQAGASALTAISGIAVNDSVFASLSTSTPTTFMGLVLESVSASTTAGYIHMKVLNLTGATFTWTATASSSVQYLDIR